MKRSRCTSVIFGAVMSLAGCYHQSAPLAPTAVLGDAPRSRVRVVLTNGQARMVYQARLVSDSVVGHAGDSSIVPVRRPNTRIALAGHEVRHVTVTRLNVGLTVVVVLAVPASVLGGIALAIGRDLGR